MDELLTTVIAIAGCTMLILFVVIFLPVCIVVELLTAIPRAVKHPISDNILVNYFAQYIDGVARMLKTVGDGFEGAHKKFEELEKEYSQE